MNGSRRVVGGSLRSGFGRGHNRGKVDWRSLLFSVFIENVRIDVRKAVLWERFGRFGRVVDVHILRSVRLGSIGSGFTFIRYKSEKDACRAIKEGSGMIFGGRKIVVSTTKDSRRSRFGVRRDSDARSPRSKSVPKAREFAFTNGRSFKEVVLGGLSKQTPNNGMLSRSAEASDDSGSFMDRNKLEIDGGGYNVGGEGKEVEHMLVSDMGSKSFVLLADIPENHSVVGKVRPGFSCNTIQNALCEDDISVIVCPFNEENLLLTFSSVDDMMLHLSNQKEFFNKWFFSLVSWKDFNDEREFSTWIRLEEVPLALSHVNFFRAMGDSWGSFGVCNGVPFSIRVSPESVSDCFFFAGNLSPSGNVSKSLDDIDYNVSSFPVLDIVLDSLEPIMGTKDINDEAAPLSREERSIREDSISASENVQNVYLLNASTRGMHVHFMDSYNGLDGGNMELGLDEGDRADVLDLVSLSPIVNKWIKSNKGKKGNESLAHRTKKKDKRKDKLCGHNAILEPIREKPKIVEGQSSKGTGVDCDADFDSEAHVDWLAAKQVGLFFKNQDSAIRGFKKSKDGAGS
ncbi:hypothetical protein COLO4_22771 [Corchorus olitorius]|uniref:RRM domain-containing protein n=1 Tax=Corchorus olitorius TaxID=93759 RepID=A0A1R3IK08_9ROSI|nr:hypothetical protein COLO4_22771 [Corchorus olitorius]